MKMELISLIIAGKRGKLQKSKTAALREGGGTYALGLANAVAPVGKTREVRLIVEVNQNGVLFEGPLGQDFAH